MSLQIIKDGNILAEGNNINTMIDEVLIEHKTAWSVSIIAPKKLSEIDELLGILNGSPGSSEAVISIMDGQDTLAEEIVTVNRNK